jgi:hypothetical protein
MCEASMANLRVPAITALYKGFAAHGLPAELSYCTHCDDEAYERALHAPLETLPHDLVDQYLADAMHHTGTAEDFPHFLPRILEREHDEGLSWFWVLPERLAAAGFAGWPAEERRLVLDALVACATHLPREDDWLRTLAEIPDVDWPAIFRAWPHATDPASREADWLETAILIRAIAGDAAPVNEAFCLWLDSDEGARFAQEHEARMDAWRKRQSGD